MIENLQQGIKKDDGKDRYDLLHPYSMEQLVKILSMGARKYAARNWENGLNWSRLIASLKRHLAAIERGEDYDPESGLLHSAHVECNAHFLTAYYKIFPQGDDRKPKYLSPKKIGLDIDGVLGDFTGHITAYFGVERIPTHWNDPIIRDLFEKVKKDEKFWATMPVKTPYTDIPFEPHCYITARSIDPKVTQKWLDDNRFPTAPLICIPPEGNKVQVAKDAGVEIFVDDCYKNFVELTNGGIFTYLFDAPYNRHYNVGHRRCFSLKELGN